MFQFKLFTGTVILYILLGLSLFNYYQLAFWAIGFTIFKQNYWLVGKFSHETLYTTGLASIVLYCLYSILRTGVQGMIMEEAIIAELKEKKPDAE